MAMFAVLDNGKLTEDYPENILVFFANTMNKHGEIVACVRKFS